MAIVKMNEFSLLAFVQDKERILKALQRFGGVQFKELLPDEARQFLKKRPAREQAGHYEGELAKVKFAIDKIAPFADRPKGFKGLTTPKSQISYDEFDKYIDQYDYAAACEKIKSHDEKQKAIKAEYNRLKAENDNLKGWSRLDVAPAQIDARKSVRYLVGVVARAQAEGFRGQFEGRFPACYVELLNTTTDGTLVLVVVPAEAYEDAAVYLKDLSFSRISVNFEKTPNELMARNEVRMLELSEAEEAEVAAIKECAADYAKLAVAYDCFKTCLERANAEDNFLRSDKVLLVEGWAAQDDAAAIEGILADVCKDGYYLEMTPVADDSQEVPIKLKNGAFARAFEGVTAMYSMPRYNEIDPTPILAPFYFLFFGIMVGDAGYGLLLVVVMFFAKKYLNLGKGVKKFTNFLFWLGFATIFAGCLYGSFFGFAPAILSPFVVNGPDGLPLIDPETGNVVRKALLDTDYDIVNMIVLSVVIGVIHVMFGQCVKAYMLVRDGKPLDAIWDSLSFMVAIFGAIAWMLSGFISGLPPVVGTAGMWAFIIGCVVIAATQGRTSPSVGGKIGSGLYAVYGLSGYVGDFVSYTRLVALSLSGAYIAGSFIIMVGIMPAGPIRIIFGGIVLILGQALNIGLAVLGAYVHTCRLQYVEFFGKFYEGGGRPFKPFELKNEAVEILN